jgi:uncharacterized protein
MNTYIKNVLGGACAVSVILIGFATYGAGRAFVDSRDPASIRSFSVNGEGVVKAIPDVAEVTLGVITESNTDVVEDLQKQNTNASNAIISFVKSRGVKKEDISTVNYDIRPKYEYSSCVFGSGKPCPPPKISGYEISHNIKVKIRDFGEIGTLLSGVVEKGANSVSQLSFTIDDESLLISNARDIAIDDARDKAKSLARVAGFGVGKILSIQEHSSPRPIFFESSMRSMDVSGSAPVVEAGTKEIKSGVTITYEMR